MSQPFCEKSFFDTISYLGGLMGFGWVVGVVYSKIMIICAKRRRQ